MSQYFPTSQHRGAGSSLPGAWGCSPLSRTPSHEGVQGTTCRGLGRVPPSFPPPTAGRQAFPLLGLCGSPHSIPYSLSANPCSRDLLIELATSQGRTPYNRGWQENTVPGRTIPLTTDRVALGSPAMARPMATNGPPWPVVPKSSATQPCSCPTTLSARCPPSPLS